MHLLSTLYKIYYVGCKCRKLGKKRRKQSFLCSKAFFRNVNLFCMARPRLSWQNKVWYPSEERKRRPWQQQNFPRWLKGKCCCISSYSQFHIKSSHTTITFLQLWSFDISYLMHKTHLSLLSSFSSLKQNSRLFLKFKELKLDATPKCWLKCQITTQR